MPAKALPAVPEAVLALVAQAQDALHLESPMAAVVDLVVDALPPAPLQAAVGETPLRAVIPAKRNLTRVAVMEAINLLLEADKDARLVLMVNLLKVDQVAAVADNAAALAVVQEDVMHS